MAEALKTHFGRGIIHDLARQISSVWKPFRSSAFIADALDGFDALELMARGIHIASALRRHLPDDYPRAVEIILASVESEPRRASGGMASFFYLPHVNFVGLFGLDDFEASMRAQHALTQRFTAEFSIRGFLERHEAATLARLHEWVTDPSPHVRRLVSEGTRPRLPWASRLRRFQADPGPVLSLLERLKDDPELYVRRSVANNLNDIGKDHPALLVKVAGAWMNDATSHREALVRHALRSLIKAGDRAALQVLGYGGKPAVMIRKVVFSPARVQVGGKVVMSFEVVNDTRRAQRVLVDLRVHFVKSTGSATPKVFKLQATTLAAGGALTCRKTISLEDLTTRKPHPGRHDVDLLVNGRMTPIGSFLVTRPR